jgi:predicted phosphoribosyltransferase
LDWYFLGLLKLTHPGVDGGLADGTTLEVGVDYVRGAEAEQRLAAVDVLPVVVGVGDVELASVFVCVAVTVADEGCLEMIVQVSIALQVS